MALTLPRTVFILFWLNVIWVGLLPPAPSFGQSVPQITEPMVKDWVQNYLNQRYQNRPVPHVIERAFKDIKPVQRVIELDRKQPEFSLSFWEYLDRVVSKQRIEEGRAKHVQHARLLHHVQQKYGIPSAILVAFWGIETGYGRHFGAFDLIPSLATLATDTRRSKFFETELNYIITLLEQGRFALENTYGSWAGAHGNFQFMPSSIYHYALDADKNGKIDLVHSLHDATESAGNYLKTVGWNAEQRWGREVLLPPNFDYAQSYDRKKPLSHWAGLGLKTTLGAPIPVVAGMQARLLIPAGHQGPKFLVYDNFDVILRWNRSNYYALAVGLLSDAIKASSSPARLSLSATRPANLPKINRTVIMKVQSILTQAGYDTNGIDGIAGSGTLRALRNWQRDHGLIADGHLDMALLKKLGLAE